MRTLFLTVAVTGLVFGLAYTCIATESANPPRVQGANADPGEDEPGQGPIDQPDGPIEAGPRTDLAGAGGVIRVGTRDLPSLGPLDPSLRARTEDKYRRAIGSYRQQLYEFQTDEAYDPGDLDCLMREGGIVENLTRNEAALDVVRRGEAYMADPGKGVSPRAVPGFRILTRFKQQTDSGRIVNVVVPIPLARYPGFLRADDYNDQLGRQQVQAKIDAFNQLPFEERKRLVDAHVAAAAALKAVLAQRKREPDNKDVAAREQQLRQQLLPWIEYLDLRSLIGDFRVR